MRMKFDVMWMEKFKPIIVILKLDLYHSLVLSKYGLKCDFGIPLSQIQQNIWKLSHTTLYWNGAPDPIILICTVRIYNFACSLPLIQKLLKFSLICAIWISPTSWHVSISRVETKARPLWDQKHFDPLWDNFVWPFALVVWYACR